MNIRHVKVLMGQAKFRICLPIQEMLVQSSCWKECLEKEMAIHYNILLIQ